MSCWRDTRTLAISVEGEHRPPLCPKVPFFSAQEARAQAKRRRVTHAGAPVARDLHVYRCRGCSTAGAPVFHLTSNGASHERLGHLTGRYPPVDESAMTTSPETAG